MRALARRFRSLIEDCRAATAVEYGLILALVVLAMVASLIAVADVTVAMWDNVSEQVQQAR